MRQARGCADVVLRAQRRQRTMWFLCAHRHYGNSPSGGKLITLFLRSAAWVSVLAAFAIVDVSAQAPQLVFTAPLPKQTLPEATARAYTVVEERGLALWA